MPKKVNILLLAFALWQVVYYLFGNPDSMIWSHVFYIVESGFVLCLFWVLDYFGWAKRWLIWLIASIYIVRVLLHGVGLILNTLFEFFNNYYLLCLGLTMAIELWVIVKFRK